MIEQKKIGVIAMNKRCFLSFLIAICLIMTSSVAFSEGPGEETEHEHDYDGFTCTVCGWMQPGFYRNDELVMSWEELEEYEYVDVQNNQLIGVHADMSEGRLVIGEDVNYIDGNYNDGFKKCNAKEVWIPRTAEIDRYEATGNETIEELRLFNSPEIIPENCFYNMNALKKVVLPEGIQFIYGSAFSSNQQLTDINLPSTVEYIGREAFYGCGFQHIDLPEGLKTIDVAAFVSTGLQSVKIPSTVENIEDSAFAYNESLESIDMSANDQLTELPNAMLWDCKALKVFLAPQTLVNFSKGVVFGNSTYSVSKIKLDLMVLPDGFKSFGKEKLVCVEIKNLVWPRSLTDVDGINNEVETIYYKGSEAQWNMIMGHTNFENSKVVFNATDEDIDRLISSIVQ